MLGVRNDSEVPEQTDNADPSRPPIKSGDGIWASGMKELGSCDPIPVLRQARASLSPASSRSRCGLR